MVPVQDYALWEAAIPKEGYVDDEYRNRVVLIKGPSLNAWEKETALFHGKLDPPCDATRGAHSGMLHEI